MRKESCDYKEVDKAIRELAKKKGEYTLEEGRWLLAARDSQVHLRFGFASLVEYIERRLGYKPRSTLERLRVAEVLPELPELTEALRSGARSWSAVREITRVAVPDNEARWLAATERKTLREVERMVKGRKPGDLPDSPRDPDLSPRVVHLELPPEVYALYRDAIDLIRKEVDPHLSEAQAFDAILHRALAGPGDEGRAPYQLALTRCEDCGRAWQKGGDQAVEVSDAVLAQAQCDAQNIGRVDDQGHWTGRPGAAEARMAGSGHVGTARATQTIPPALRRKILRRDGGRCCVPGCRNTLGLSVHHFHPKAEGGQHDPDQMGAMCPCHHGAVHRGALIIEGTVRTGLTFLHADGTPYGGAADPAAIDASQSAFAGLRSLGIAETSARALIAGARAALGEGAKAEALVEHAVRHQGSARTATSFDSDAAVLGGLRSLGFSSARSRALLADARAHVAALGHPGLRGTWTSCPMGADASAEALIEQALRISGRDRHGASFAREAPAPAYQREPGCETRHPGRHGEPVAATGTARRSRGGVGVLSARREAAPFPDCTGAAA